MTAKRIIALIVFVISALIIGLLTSRSNTRDQEGAGIATKTGYADKQPLVPIESSVPNSPSRSEVAPTTTKTDDRQIVLIITNSSGVAVSGASVSAADNCAGLLAHIGLKAVMISDADGHVPLTVSRPTYPWVLIHKDGFASRLLAPTDDLWPAQDGNNHTLTVKLVAPVRLSVVTNDKRERAISHCTVRADAPWGVEARYTSTSDNELTTLLSPSGITDDLGETTLLLSPELTYRVTCDALGYMPLTVNVTPDDINTGHIETQLDAILVAVIQPPRLNKEDRDVVKDGYYLAYRTFDGSLGIASADGLSVAKKASITAELERKLNLQAPIIVYGIEKTPSDRQIVYEITYCPGLGEAYFVAQVPMKPVSEVERGDVYTVSQPLKNRARGSVEVEFIASEDESDLPPETEWCIASIQESAFAYTPVALSREQRPTKDRASYIFVMPPGRYRIMHILGAMVRCFKPVEITIEADKVVHVQVPLSREMRGALTITLTDELSRPRIEWSAHLMGKKNISIESTGEAPISRIDLAPGRYSITIGMHGYESAAAEIEVRAGEVEEVNVVVSKATNKLEVRL